MVDDKESQFLPLELEPKQPDVQKADSAAAASDRAEVTTEQLNYHWPWRLRKLHYSPQDLQTLVGFYRSMAEDTFIDGKKIDNPYFNFTDKQLLPYVDHHFADGTRLFVGPIGAVSEEQFAAAMMEQQYIYVHRGTMGSSFPTNDQAAVEALQATMIGDYSPDRVVVMLHATDEDNCFVPLAGVQAYWGTIDHTLEKYFTDPASQPTSLSSFWATGVQLDAPELQAFLKTFGGVTEKEVVLMSRLFSQEPVDLARAGVNQSGIAWLMMAALAVGIDSHNRQHPNEQQAQMVLYDTHLDIQKKLELHFDMQVLAEAQHVFPSAAVLETILRYHYGSAEEFGGFAGQFVLGYQSIPHYLVKAKELLTTKGVVLPNAYV